MKKTILYLLAITNTTVVLIGFLMSCKSKEVQRQTIETMETPPGLVKFRTNLYVDKTEITNFSYLEFAWWTGRVYGQTSEEYSSIYPDSTSWAELGPGRTPFLTYFQHPAYRHYPVVCINDEQAQQFSKWRSDRVMEFMLIREGIIKHSPQTHRDSVFTIEKYFSGNYHNITPHPNIRYYPDYQLPDTAIYVKLLPFADSLETANYSSRKNHKLGKQDLSTCNFQEHSTQADRSDKLRSTACPTCKPLRLVHLKGNALELTKLRGIGFGGSFKTPCDLVSTQHFYPTDSLTYTLGFRNICVWRKWE